MERSPAAMSLDNSITLFASVFKAELASCRDAISTSRAVQVAETQQQLADTRAAAPKQKQRLDTLKQDVKAAMATGLAISDIQTMGRKMPLSSNVVLTEGECRTLKDLAVSSFAERSEKLTYKRK